MREYALYMNACLCMFESGRKGLCVCVCVYEKRKCVLPDEPGECMEGAGEVLMLATELN